MRWIFADRGSSREGRDVAEIEGAIDAWWAAFDAKRSDLHDHFNKRSQWDLPEWMQEHLGAIDDGLMWEFGPSVKGAGHRLVITPESRKDLRPLANSMVALAPTFPGWEFYPYRLPEEIADARLSAEARTGRTGDDFEVVVEEQEHHLVSLKFRSPTVRGADDTEAMNAAFVLAESLLGEAVLDHWIGEIAVEKTRKGLLGFGKSQGNAVPLERLHSVVQSQIDSIRDRLPDRPHVEWFESAEYSLLRLEPEEADDYPGRTDLLTMVTLNPDLFAASMTHGFASERFSNFKETFCYLKLDGTAELLKSGEVDDRSKIEDALNELLKSSKTGCVMGGGTGLKYSYIDLAIVEFTRTARTICQRLRDLDVPKNSWLLFHDADYCDEWLGMYPDTPPPPMPEEE